MMIPNESISFFISFFAVAVIVGLALVAALLARKPKPPTHGVPPEKLAGKRGEARATLLLSKHLQEGDVLLTNIAFEHEGRSAELDNVVINEYGVFIIEVKNYVGELYGGEDDHEWKKLKTTDAGNVYVKTVKNPIKQVKRQVYLLAQHLRRYGIDVWINGYALLLGDNSPVDSDMILTTESDFSRILHTSRRQRLSRATIQRVYDLLFASDDAPCGSHQI